MPWPRSNVTLTLGFLLSLVSVPSKVESCRLIQVDWMATPGWALAVDAAEGRAAVAMGSAGVAMVDVADPEQPRLLEVVSTPGVADSPAFFDGLLLVGVGSSLVVIDLGPPAVLLSILEVGDTVAQVACQGSSCFLAARGAGLVSVDLADPGRPALVTTAVASGLGRGVLVSEETAWLMAWEGGLDVFAVGDPTIPTRIGHLDTSDRAVRAARRGDILLLAGRQAGLEVIDVSDASSPRLINRLPMKAQATDVLWAGNLALVADFPDRVALIDVTDPALPREVGRWFSPGSARSLARAGDRFLLADSEGSLSVLALEGCRATPQSLPAVTPAAR